MKTKFNQIEISHDGGMCSTFGHPIVDIKNTDTNNSVSFTYEGKIKDESDLLLALDSFLESEKVALSLGENTPDLNEVLNNKPLHKFQSELADYAFWFIHHGL